MNKPPTWPEHHDGLERARTDEARKPRSDGEQSRERLLMAAMRLFAAHGFAKTSTRMIAQAAGANVAAISYYFGDKAGLYRALFSHESPGPKKDPECFSRPEFSLRQALQGFYGQLLAQMCQGDLAQVRLRLWFRELLEPTGLWAAEIDNSITPMHTALAALLCRHLGLARPDEDLHRLAFSVAGLGIQMMVTRDVIMAIQPQLITSAQAIETWAARLVDYAEAMIATERSRREETP